MFAHQKTANAAELRLGQHAAEDQARGVGDERPCGVGIAEAGEPEGLGQQLGEHDTTDEQQDRQRVPRERQARAARTTDGATSAQPTATSTPAPAGSSRAASSRHSQPSTGQRDDAWTRPNMTRSTVPTVRITKPQKMAAWHQARTPDRGTSGPGRCRSGSAHRSAPLRLVGHGRPLGDREDPQVARHLEHEHDGRAEEDQRRDG